MRFCLLLISFFFSMIVQAQGGSISGTIIAEKGEAVEGVSLQLIFISDTTKPVWALSGTNGAFSFKNTTFGLYRLKGSLVGMQPFIIDSIILRVDKPDINLGEIILKESKEGQLQEIIIYAEKPLIQSKDGNLTFNASESPMSQGSNTSDLLTQVPLITKDPNGKLLVRGKEPKILIDDKPVELNQQQLQDLLESMPGSSIEKIEVMTNPPAQFASEQGGVINIVTRKGTVGISGRLSVFAGSRGELGTNESLNYRKTGLTLNMNAGLVHNQFTGISSSTRQNNYSDSSNQFKTGSGYTNTNLRPNFRASVDYEVSKVHNLNFVVQYNANDFQNNNETEFQNINRFGNPYRLSRREIESTGIGRNPNLSFTYTLKTKRAGEVFRIFTNLAYSENNNDRLFYQQFLAPDYSFTAGNDSTQLQLNNSISRNNTIRLSYDKPLGKNKMFLSVGGQYNKAFSDVDVSSFFRRKGDGALLPLNLLSNHFYFNQDITNFRASIKKIFQKNYSFTSGLAVEKTAIHFDLKNLGKDTGNRYWTPLPFVNFNKNWASGLNLTFSYRRTLRRPGINELNPTKDFSDPYNIRSGNPGLLASPAHNFDWVMGKNKGKIYVNVGLGYNSLDDLFNPIRTLLPDGTTETIWQNISRREEYELSTWSGYSFSKKLRMNVSASYTHNKYGAYDKTFRRFRDGGSFTSNLTGNFTIVEGYTGTGSFTFNRFANPQGTVRNNLSMNLSVQARMMKKKLTLTLNCIDPFLQQQNRSITYGPNFFVENFSTTQTRNYRLTLGYSFSKTIRKSVPKKAMIVPKRILPKK